LFVFLFFFSLSTRRGGTSPGRRSLEWLGSFFFFLFTFSPDRNRNSPYRYARFFFSSFLCFFFFFFLCCFFFLFFLFFCFSKVLDNSNSWFFFGVFSLCFFLVSLGFWFFRSSFFLFSARCFTFCFFFFFFLFFFSFFPSSVYVRTSEFFDFFRIVLAFFVSSCIHSLWSDYSPGGGETGFLNLVDVAQIRFGAGFLWWIGAGR